MILKIFLLLMFYSGNDNVFVLDFILLKRKKIKEVAFSFSFSFLFDF